MKQKKSVLHIVLIVWLVIATLYVAYGEYNRLTNFVAKKAYERGVSDAVVQVIQEAQDCKSFPVNIGDQRVDLINLACVLKPEGAPAQPVPSD